MPLPKILPTELFKQLKQDRQKQREQQLIRQQASTDAAANPENMSDTDGMVSDPASLGVKVRNEMYESVFKIPDVYYFPFETPGLDKPWLDNKEKMEEYFNYGFTEESFKVYAKKLTKFAEQNM